MTADNCMNNIDKTLVKLLNEKYNLNVDIENIDVLNKNIMGTEFNLSPVDMLCLFFDVENLFNIRIPQEDIVSGKFNSFSNIINMISELLKSVQ